MYIIGFSADNAYFPVSFGYNILHYLIGRFFIVHNNRRYLRISVKSIRHHRRNSDPLRKAMNHPRMAGNINYAVQHNRIQLFHDRVENRMITGLVAEPGIIPSGIKTKVLHNCAIPSFLTEAHDALYDFRRRKLRDIFRNDTDGFCFLIPQSLRNIIWPVSPPVNDFQNAGFCLLSDFRFSVQDIGHGSR